jgi:hypothetical protein
VLQVRSVPSSSAYQYPSRGHRVEDAYGVACDRFATRDPPTAHQGFAPMRKMGKEQEQRPLRRQACMVTSSCGTSVDTSYW